jgi:uncharacterized protein YuzE
MRDRYLEATFRKGKLLAAYLYLPRAAGAKTVRTEPRGDGILVDYGADGRPIGIEITAPATRLDAINAVLADLGFASADHDELAPIAAA